MSDVVPVSDLVDRWKSGSQAAANELYQRYAQLSALSGINCALLADTGISFLFGYAPGGDLTQFQGAVFTFATTP